MNTNTLHDRLSSAAGNMSYRKIARLTGVHAETARRYMQGQSPSVEFIQAFCEQLGVAPAWLLMGRGPMREDQVTAYALRNTEPGELLAAVGGVLQSMAERIERLESRSHSHGLGSTADVHGEPAVEEPH